MGKAAILPIAGAAIGALTNTSDPKQMFKNALLGAGLGLGGSAFLPAAATGAASAGAAVPMAGAAGVAGQTGMGGALGLLPNYAALGAGSAANAVPMAGATGLLGESAAGVLGAPGMGGGGLMAMLNNPKFAMAMQAARGAGQKQPQMAMSAPHRGTPGMIPQMQNPAGQGLPQLPSAEAIKRQLLMKQMMMGGGYYG